MRYIQMSSVIFVACLLTSCLKEGTNCPNCPRGTTSLSGKVIFFAKQNCEGNTPYSVIIDDTMHVAVMVTSGIPDCNNDAVAPTMLKAGTHKWKASCSEEGNVLSGTITVTGGTCVLKEIR